MSETIKISNSEAALIGLLSEQPMYPYQIEQQVKYRDMRSWTDLSMSSIYKTLQKLEQKGLLTRKDEVSSENRIQKIYTISKQGEKALQEKIETLLSEPEHKKWQIDIGTYNLNLIPKEKAQAAFTKYRQALQKKIQEYEALLKFLQDEECPSYRFNVASRQMFLLNGELRWIDTCLEQQNLQRDSQEGKQ
jgi:DNA-binding PadR family transcriptional regulator